jgi:hypothetical protein
VVQPTDDDLSLQIGICWSWKKRKSCLCYPPQTSWHHLGVETTCRDYASVPNRSQAPESIPVSRSLHTESLCLLGTLSLGFEILLLMVHSVLSPPGEHVSPSILPPSMSRVQSTLAAMVSQNRCVLNFVLCCVVRQISGPKYLKSRRFCLA